MSSALIGILGLLAIVHLLLVIIPIIHTIRAPISGRSKLAWYAFLLLLPFIGVFYFHRKFRLSLFLGKKYEPSSRDVGAPSGFSRRDHDDLDV